MAFRTNSNDTVTTIGVSGLLYKRNLLLYNRLSKSLWSQVKGQAVSGPHKWEHLVSAPIEHTTCGYWKKQHPETIIISRDAGYWRDYLRSQYGDYDENGDIYFPVSFLSSQYHPKERVIGVNTNDRFKAHPLVELYLAKSPLEDLVAGLKLFLEFKIKTQNGIIHDDIGRVLPSINDFCFTCYTFHPNTQIFYSVNLGLARP